MGGVRALRLSAESLSPSQLCSGIQMNYHTTLSYDAALDRLINGEQYRPFQHLLTKTSLMSARRAGALFEAIKEYGEAYDAHFGLSGPGARPYPTALAGIQLNEFPVEEHGRPCMISIPELFALDELSTAPPEYFELVNLVCIVGGRSLAHERVPSLRPQAMTNFAQELFRLIFCAHLCYDSVLSHGAGTCLIEDFVTALGWCTDFYFLTSVKGESERAIFSARCRDIVEGFSLIVRQADSPAAIVAGLDEAVQVYTPAGLGETQVSALIRNVAEATNPRRKQFAYIAEMVLSGGG
jgi:hypothetical protein